MRDYLNDDEPVPGRVLVESGEAVAGSMSRSAAAILFDPRSSRVQLDDRLARCLREAAQGASPLALPRERYRAGAALAFAVELAVTRAAQGRNVRTDAFLGADGIERPDLDEVADAVLLAARQTAEEWRVRHLGYALAEAAFSPDLDAGVVLRGLRLAGALTGRQLVFVASVGRRERVPLPMAALPHDPQAWTAWGALEDLTDLQRRGLIDPPIALPRPGAAALPRLRMADLRLTRRGVLVHRLLALDLLHENAVVTALAELGLPRS